MLACTDIEAKRLLPPLMVIQIISSNTDRPKPLSVVKDYIIGMLKQEMAQIAEVQLFDCAAVSHCGAE